MAVLAQKKVADITLGELKELIREVILETIDPNYGLELRDEALRALPESFEQQAREEGILLEEAQE